MNYFYKLDELLKETFKLDLTEFLENNFSFVRIERPVKILDGSHISLIFLSILVQASYFSQKRITKALITPTVRLPKHREYKKFTHKLRECFAVQPKHCLTKISIPELF